MKFYKNIYFIIDILIVAITFSVLHFFKYNTFQPSGLYSILFVVFFAYWILLSVYQNKYSLAFISSYRLFFKSLLWSTALAFFLTISTVSLTELRGVSRLFLIKMTVIPMLVESILIGIIRFSIPKDKSLNIHKSVDTDRLQIAPINNKLVIVSAISLIITYFLMIKIKTGSFYIYDWSERILLLLFVSWLISLILTKKYAIQRTRNIYYQITPFIKAGIIMFLISSGIFYFFRVELISRFLLFGTIITFTTFELIIQIFYYYLNIDKNIDTALKNSNSLPLNWTINKIQGTSDGSDHNLSISDIINQISLLPSKENIIKFLQNGLINVKFSTTSITILSTTSIQNVESLTDSSMEILVNLHKLNDVRRLNQYLIACHSKLNTEGYLVGQLLPIETMYKHLRSKMPKLIFTLIYPIHFLVFRIIPKIPKINRLYFIITKGKNRSISKYELYGRLNFCGFKVVSDQLINDNIYFIAKKVKTISPDKNPSYHPIVKLDRIGLNKEIITIHKFRTMYPYSEYLQKDIYNDNELDSSGKFKNDPRIATWGKIFRKYWIDELPQLYDWIQGRLNLVGVRAISEHYFSLYPKELQEYRTQFKPGIIPPYYVDMPSNLEEIFESEWKYLQQKGKAPFKTDIKYALQAFINIIFKGARSK